MSEPDLLLEGQEIAGAMLEYAHHTRGLPCGEYLVAFSISTDESDLTVEFFRKSTFCSAKTRAPKLRVVRGGKDGDRKLRYPELCSACEHINNWASVPRCSKFRYNFIPRGAQPPDWCPLRVGGKQ